MAISLASIQKTKHAAPPRMVVHGDGFVGKSTFFAGAPAPIFIPTEDGLSGIDTNAFPLAERYSDVMEAIQLLRHEQHEFRSAFIDSADWLETLIHAKVCEDSGEKTIELAAGGYGKGYGEAILLWQEVLGALDALNKEKGMIVGFTCHSAVIQVNDPTVEPFDRYELKLHQSKRGVGARALVVEWADILGFAQSNVFVSSIEIKDGSKSFSKAEQKAQVARGVTDGRRLLHLVGTPAYSAGNRYELPPTIDLNWSAFSAAISAASAPKQPNQSQAA